MRCLAVCQDELVIRMLDEILLPGFEVEFIIENRPLARRLHEAGVTVTAGDPRRTDTYLKADIGPSTCVIIEKPYWTVRILRFGNGCCAEARR